MSGDLDRLARPDQKFGIVIAAATSWPSILPGEASFRSTRPALPPPLDRQATRSPVLSCLAMLSSERSSLLNSPGP
jgi:hypothetical protein